MSSEERRRDNLPADLTGMVGRRREMAAIVDQLDRSRLVTLVGTGGVGKTRLALGVAHRLRRSFPDGVWLTELADLTEPQLLPVAVLHALAGGPHGGSRGEGHHDLLRHIGDKHLLMVLDNCEHLGTAATELVETTLRACPHVRILATSREPLRTAVEALYYVPPLSVPPEGTVLTGGDAGRYEAVALLCERASAAAPWFSLTDPVLTKVAVLCQWLDGVPLALELAAVGLRAISLDEMLARWADGDEVLGRRRGVAPRHQTLRAALDWSYELCTTHERILWARLSIFAGGIDLSAAEQVAASGALTPDTIWPGLRGLVEKSVVTFDGTQYRMLETIRHYGLERLRARGEVDSMRDRHCAYVAALAGRLEAGWYTREQPRVLQEARRNLANIRSALDFCLSAPGRITDGMNIAASLWMCWITCGLLTEGRHWLERFLSRDAGASKERVSAMWVGAYLAVVEGTIPPVFTQLHGCLDLAATVGDPAGRAHATHTLGLARLLCDDVSEAIALLEEGVALEREIAGPNPYLPPALVSLSAALLSGGRVDDAVVVLSEVRDACAQRGDLWLQSWSVLFLGLAEWIRGRVAAARPLLREAVAMKCEMGDSVGSAHAIEFLAWVAQADGDPRSATVLLGISRRLFEPLGAHLVGFKKLERWSAECAARARSDLGDDAYNRHLRAGHQFSADEMVSFALGRWNPPTRAAERWRQLSRRETQIAGLVALAMSNKEIAGELGISPRTVESHVDHILTKLGVTSRAKLAVLFSREHPGSSYGDLAG